MWYQYETQQREVRNITKMRYLAAGIYQELVSCMLSFEKKKEEEEITVTLLQSFPKYWEQEKRK